MTTARPKEGPRAPLFYSVPVALACAGLVHAQAVDQSALERCAGLATAEQKLACFESVVNEGRADAEPTAETTAEPLTAPAPAVGPEPDAVSVPAAAPASAPMVEDAREPGREPATNAPAAQSADDFGREHIGSVDEAWSETLTATVVEVTKTGYGELEFHLDNGQVWRQHEKRYYPYPRNQQFEVTLSRGMLGEYQLQVGGAGRKVNVRRVK